MSNRSPDDSSSKNPGERFLVTRPTPHTRCSDRNPPLCELIGAKKGLAYTFNTKKAQIICPIGIVSAKNIVLLGTKNNHTIK